MKNYKFLNNLAGWIAFIIAAIVYLMTIEPTASFWDCGEFISSAYKLEVGHPPGAPLFMLIGRLFSLLAPSPDKVATMINSMSALASAFTILFLFWSITHLGRKLFGVTKENMTVSHGIAIIGAGFVGSMAYTFSDTFWFSAVEGEVYAMSSLFTAAVFWAILKWDDEADKPHANRWFILIAYLFGLSIGVHLLNLLTVPAIGLVYYFRKYNPTWKGTLYALLISGGVLLAILYGLIPGVVTIAAYFDLFFVNVIGLPFNSGALFFMLLLFAGLAYGIWLTYQKGKVLWNTALLFVTLIMIGYSSFALILIRANANTPMNQNSPDNMFTLLSYLNREQYGDRPLMYGQYYSAPMVSIEETGSVRQEVNGKYKIVDSKQKGVYEEGFKTVFPRMWSNSPTHIKAYKAWGRVKGRMTYSKKERKQIQVPKQSENMRFFVNYQLGFMYWRYFFWNFVGRQNDEQGNGELLKGNWISGINFIDKHFVGDQKNLPDSLKNNPGRNTYYFIPLLLGLFGIAFQIYKGTKKGYENFAVVLMLFFMTGIAIVIYLNQYPYQPRERDYAFAGSFYAFSIWIGLGVLFLYDLLSQILSNKVSAGVATMVSLVVPVVLGAENWNDHNRSNRYVARDFAENYLNSCEEDAIIFTNGDNDTFPLWYAQEVEGIRNDIRVCNLSYLQTDWYTDQMRHKAYNSDPVPFALTKDQTRTGVRDVVYTYGNYQGEPLPLKTALDFVGSDKRETKMEGDNDFIPGYKFYIPIDTAKVVEMGVVQPEDASLIVDKMNIDIKKVNGGRYLKKNDLMVLDLISTNEWVRPMYFAVTVPSENYVNLQDYFQIEGLAYRIVPIQSEENNGEVGRIQPKIMYENMMKFKFGGIERDDVYVDENIRRMCTNYRNYFGILAQELNNMGEKEKALNAMKRCREAFPAKKIPFNYWSLRLADAAFEVGDKDFGREIVEALSKDAYEQLIYFFSLKPKFRTQLDQDIALQAEVIRWSAQIAEKYQEKDLSADIDQKMSDIQRLVK